MIKQIMGTYNEAHMRLVLALWSEEPQFLAVIRIFNCMKNNYIQLLLFVKNLPDQYEASRFIENDWTTLSIFILRQNDKVV